MKNIACGQNRYIRAYPRCQADIGKSMTFYGEDSKGQTVLVKQADGTWQAGMKVILSIPFSSTSTQFRSITRVSKDKTECPVDVYQYDPVTNLLEDVAHYEPDQTEPAFIFSVLSGMNWNTQSCPAKQVDVLAKIAIKDLSLDSDVMAIQNLEALKALVQAIKLGEQGNIEAQRAMVQDAVHQLNLQDWDENPEDTVPVQWATFGTATLARHGIGRNI